MGDKVKVNLPLGTKPMDPTRKTWINYDWLTLGIKRFPKTLPKTMSSGKVDKGPPSSCSDWAFLTDSTFSDAVSRCLSEAPFNGLCTKYGLATKKIGTMPDWDVSSVKDMRGVGNKNFYYKSTFNGDISRWNTSGVTNMQRMFQGASSFNQPIGSWNTGQVTDMQYMFHTATSFNHYVGDWDTSGLANSYYSISYIFRDATAFNAKYTCTGSYVIPSACKTVRSDWVAPPPPPS